MNDATTNIYINKIRIQQGKRSSIIYYGNVDCSFHLEKTVYAGTIHTHSVQELQKLIVYCFSIIFFYFVLYLCCLIGYVGW
jgi:hypothetical protein